MTDIPKRTRKRKEREPVKLPKLSIGDLEAQVLEGWAKAYYRDLWSADKNPHPEGIASLLPK